MKDKDRGLPKNPIKITNLSGLTAEEANIRQLESDCFAEVIQDQMLMAGYRKLPDKESIRVKLVQMTYGHGTVDDVVEWIYGEDKT